MTKKTDTLAFAMPLDFMTEYNSKAFEQFKGTSTEMVSFVTKRFTEDMALPRKLASCKDAVDIMEVWADFYKTAFDDYAAQSTKMLALMEKATTDSQAAVKEMADAGEAALKQLDAKAA